MIRIPQHQVDFQGLVKGLGIVQLCLHLGLQGQHQPRQQHLVQQPLIAALGLGAQLFPLIEAQALE